MITSENRIRRLIRKVILEQVVGYQAPSKSYDDALGDEAHNFSVPTTGKGASAPAQSDSDSSDANQDDSDSSGYMQIGDVSVATSKSDTASQKTAVSYL